MPIDPDFLVPGGALQSKVLGRALQRIGGDAGALAPGTLIGPYRIERELGRGGMAVVYLAHRADGEFEQSVALKLVRPDGDSEFAQALLRKERQILASLQHPCIARLLDGGRTADGVLWFALELVHGTRIDRYCRERRLPLARRLALFIQLCDAVQFAHSRLLIHRDIKPANILVTREESVKLLDFGIAQLLAPGADDALSQRALTPGYASPEQLRGEPATTTSDIHQLGRVLQSLLAADRAAGSDDEATATESTTLQPIATQHSDVRAAPSPTRDLAAIIDKAMRPLPGERYATAAELKADIENFIARRPVQARAGGSVYRLNCFLRRHPWSIATATAAMVLFATMVAMFTLRIASERDQARSAALQAQQAAARANQVRDFLVGMFQVADPNVNRGDKLTATQILERGAADIDKALAGQTALQANLLVVIGEVFASLGDYPRAEPLLARAVALERRDARIPRVELGHALRLFAHAEHKLDKFAQARDLLNEAEPLLRGQAQAQSELAAVLNQRGLAQKHLNDLDGALASHQAALSVARAAGDDERVALIGNSLGLTLYNMDRFAEAQVVYEEALAVLRRLYGERNTHTSATEENLAMVLAARGNFDQALELMKSAAATERELIGEDNGDYPTTLNLLANIYADAGRDAEAATTYENALAIARRTGRGESEDAGSILNNLGSVYAKQKKYAQARACLEQAIAIHTKLNGADYVSNASTQTMLAEIDLEEGKPQRAEQILREALKKLDGKLPPNHTFIVVAKIALARALIAERRSDEARQLILATLDTLPGKDSEDMAKQLRDLLATVPAR